MPEPATLTLVGTGFVAMGVRYLRRKYRSAKPLFDRTIAMALLIALSPVIAVCALLVKLTSRGPAFYRQERVGENGRTFSIVKLRTMCHDAEAKTGPVWADGDKDPRVTPVGYVLRKTYLDELPQLVNVLRGEMSLVGPRPERPYFVDRLKKIVPDYESRLKVKPGITGLAQVRARADRELRDVRRKVKLDAIYTSRMCWWVDFMILLRTMGKFAGRS
jgi:lipopolysaccharide/colanic/teichoic acid biosynthesis glycosyltransferase